MGAAGTDSLRKRQPASYLSEIAVSTSQTSRSPLRSSPMHPGFAPSQWLRRLDALRDSHRNFWIGLTAILVLGGDARGGARGAGGGGLGSAESQAGLAPGIERDRGDAEARDPARGRPRGLRQRLRLRQPAGHAGGLRQLGELRAGDAPLPGAAEHRAGEARAGVGAGELRALPRRPPGAAAGPPLGVARRRLPGAARRQAPVLLLCGGGTGQEHRRVHPRGGGLLLPGPRADHRQGFGRSQLRAGRERLLDHPRGLHAGVPRREGPEDGGATAACVRGMARGAAGARRGARARARRSPAHRDPLRLPLRHVPCGLLARQGPRRRAGLDEQPAQRLDRADPDGARPHAASSPTRTRSRC